MTAKEMFESLGYTYYDNSHLNVGYFEYHTENDVGEESIRFHFSKIVSVHAIVKNGLKRCVIPAPLNMDELKAITKQCEELGWLK